MPQHKKITKWIQQPGPLPLALPGQKPGTPFLPLCPSQEGNVCLPARNCQHLSALSVDKFGKIFALYHYCILPPAPSSPPPVPTLALAKVGTSALIQGSEVLLVETLLGDANMQDAPMALDKPSPWVLDKQTQLALWQLAYPTTVIVHNLISQHRLDFIGSLSTH